MYSKTYKLKSKNEKDKGGGKIKMTLYYGVQGKYGNVTLNFYMRHKLLMYT